MHAFKLNLGRRPDKPTTDEQLKIMANALSELGKRTADVGLRLAPHPHIWSPLERLHEVERVLELTDPELVYLTADTAHLTLGGIDPVRLIRRHYSRVAALHWKDTPAKYHGRRGPTPSRDEHSRVNLYKNLGTGGVDFPAILEILRKRNFQGWVTLDFNRPRPGEGTIEENISHANLANPNTFIGGSTVGQIFALAGSTGVGPSTSPMRRMQFGLRLVF